MKHPIEGDPLANAYTAARKRRDEAQEGVMAAASAWAHDKTDANLLGVDRAVQAMIEAGEAVDALLAKVKAKP